MKSLQSSEKKNQSTSKKRDHKKNLSHKSMADSDYDDDDKSNNFINIGEQD